MRRILSTVATYIRSKFFMHLCVPCYCDACLKSSALRVGMKTLTQYTIPGVANTSIAMDRSTAEPKLVDRARFCNELTRYLKRTFFNQYCRK